MKNYKGKKRERKIERTILAITIVLVLAIGSISPASIIFAYDGSSEIINATFSETKAEDKMSATIHLNIAEKEDQEIQSIKLPDGNEVTKDTFKRNDKKEILVDYKADKNSEYAYSVFYTEKKKVTETAVKEESEAITAPVLEEKITHEVTDLKVMDDFKLTIIADDISFSSIDKVDVMSGIVIKNEDDKDITASQSVSVVDYGKLFSGVAGTYPVKYETLYSNNEKTYTFSRDITITETTEKKVKSKAATPKTEDFGISLSTGNTSLTDPKDFVIGKTDQETFNITVFYNDSSAELDRKLKVFIPKGFTPQGRLDSSSLDGAANIEYETLADGQTVVTITFVDGRTVVTGFDMNIKQDKKYLYDMADVDKQGYSFRVEQLVGATSMASKEFQLTTEKLKDSFEDGSITIDSIKTTTVNSGRRIYASNSDEKGTIVIKRKAFTDLSVSQFTMPSSIYLNENKQYFSYDKYSLYLGDKEIMSGNLAPIINDDEFVLERRVMSAFTYAYEDVTLKLYNVNTSYFAGDIYYSPDTPYKTTSEFSMYDSGGNKKTLGYISVNPQLENPNIIIENDTYGNAFQGLNGSKLALRQGKRFEGLNNDLYYSFSIGDNENVFKSVESVFEFPYTVQPFAVSLYLGYTERIKKEYKQGLFGIELTTNKRKLILKHDDHPFVTGTTFINFEKDLQEGEYVSKIKVNHTTTENMYINFGYNIMNTDEGGNELPDKQAEVVKVAISSPQAPSYKKNYEFNIDLLKDRDSTALSVSSARNNTSHIGQSSFGMAPAEVLGKFNQKSEKELIMKMDSEITSSKQFLSVVDRLHIESSNLYDGSLQLEYSTNLQRDLIAQIDKTSDYDFKLADGEYLTNLQIRITDFECKEVNSRKLSSPDDDSVLFNLSFSSDNVPEQFPVDGKDTQGISDFYYILEKPDGTRLSYSRSRETFKPTAKHNFEIATGSKEEGLESSPEVGVLNRPLFSIRSDSSDKHKVKEVKINFDGTNKDLLSMIGSIRMSYYESSLQYKTNLGRDVTVNIRPDDFRELSLAHNEYITEMQILIKDYDGISSPQFISFNRREDYPRTLPIDGAMITSRNNNQKDPWEVKAEVDQDGKKEDITGSSVVVHATSSVLIKGSDFIANATSNGIPKYQGQTEDLILPILPIQLNGINRSRFFVNREDYNYVRLENPIVYFIIDKNFSVNPDDIDKQGNDIDIQFKEGVMPDGDSVLTFKFKNFEKIYRSGDHKDNIISIMDNIKIPALVKLDAKTTKTSALKGMYYNLDDSIKEYDNYLSTLKKEDSRFEVVPELGNKSLYKMEVKTKAIDLLPLTEMGVSVIGQHGDAETTKNVVGYDHEVYKQKLSIISNLTQPTYDWELYIPVPKKGKSVKYSNTTGVVEGPKAEYSMYLDSLLDPTEFPTGSKIEYTTDADPLYSLDGTSVGNYTETQTNLKDITMIHITIPKLDAKQKVFPTIKYKVDGEKQKVGKQIVLGGTYFNLKLGSASGKYYKDGGIFADRLDFALKDFVISGTVWQDTLAQSNSVIDDIDVRLANVTVKAVDKNKVEYTTKTALDGTYQISIPSNGKVDLIVNKPNDLKADPIKKYRSVYPSIDNMFVDKDETTSTASATLTDSNISYMSAGLYGLKSISVVGKEVVLKIGTTVAVPAIVFPNEVEIIYDNTNDNNIATVSSSGMVTGIKLGETKATVRVEDMEGTSDNTEAEYTIKVVPDHVPTVETTDINTFGSVGYDPKAGIVIKDGIDEVISVNDTSKVTIDDSLVDTLNPGKYPIIYTVNDGYNEITYTRFVYVHGDVVINKPADITLKQGSNLFTTEGATASYIHVNTDGTKETIVVPVTSTLGSSILLSNIEVINIPLHAEVTLGTVKSEVNASYLVRVHGVTTIDAIKPVVTVKVGETMANIKKLIQATASMETPEGIVNPTINWDNFKGFDTTKPSNTITANITAIDPDYGSIVSKEITIHISKAANITALDKTDTVVGDKFDPTKNITIIDGDGNPVVVTPDMISKNDIPVSADGTSTTPGNYDVEYKYTDAYGNEATAKTTVKVHGALQFDDTRVDRIQTAPGDTDDLNDKANLAKLAWYINSDGDKQPANFVNNLIVNPSINGRHTQEITFKHPFKADEQTFSRKIYTHGKTIIKAPTEKVVKVGTKVNKVDGATATYIHAYDLTNETKDVLVSSSTGDTITSNAPTVIEVPLYAVSVPAPGLNNTATGKYNVVFNGYPEIRTGFDSIKVRVGATPDEIKKLIQVQASVHYGKDALPTDITNLVNWDDLANVDTSVKKAEYTFKISVTDKDGATVEKEIKVLISDEIIMNLPNVDKVIGDTFDPFDNVEILDGNGNKVDFKDVTVDGSKVDMDNPGSYEVEYTYKDEFGNEKTETNTIRVNGKLQIEGLDRIDLIEKKDVTYLPNSGKAFYIDYNKKKVTVPGAYDRNVDQSVVKKNEVLFQATHPVNKEISSGKQNVYVHGDIEFHQKDKEFIGKVGSTVDTKDNYTASYKHVNDDGTITKKDIPVIGKDVTSDKVGYENSEVSAKVEIIDGLVNEKKQDVKVAFNGLPFIQSASTLYFKGEPTRDQIIKAMEASAGMKKADGIVVDLTTAIDYSELDNVTLSESGKYTVTITVKDQDGFVTYKDIEITIDIPQPEKPVDPGGNGDGNNGENTNNGNNGNNANDGNNGNNTDADDKKDDVITVITKDIPKGKAENGITDELIKSYITANSKNSGRMDFKVISHTVKGKVGTYEATIRFADGSERTVSIKVVDDALRDVQQPEFGRDVDCIIQWILLLLLLGYSGFGITAILKRRQEIAKLEKMLGKYSENVEGEVNK